MKKIILGSFMMLTLLILAACGGGSDSGSAESGDGGSGGEVYELDVNNYTPSTHHYAYNVFDPWAELVEEKTDGRVKVNVYHGGSLGPATSVYQDVSGGLYDVGLPITQYHYDTGFFPYTVGNLPFAFEKSDEAHYILEQIGEKYAKEHLTDVILMTPTVTDPYDLFTKEPVRSVEDLSGKRMRANGKAETSFIEGLGATPVNITLGDTYEGLERGMIDTTFFGVVGSLGYKFHEPAPYATKVEVTVTPVVPIMNKEFFESLPEDLQTLFKEELNPAFTELVIESYKKEREVSYVEAKEVISERGEFIELPDEELQKFKEAGRAAWDEWIEDANSRGYDGQAIVNDFFELLEEVGYEKPF